MKGANVPEMQTDEADASVAQNGAEQESIEESKTSNQDHSAHKSLVEEESKCLDIQPTEVLKDIDEMISADQHDAMPAWVAALPV